ncbi:PIG-L family deacetylase [Aurantimonas sp. HBX-1]|uniref:PIG-L family deacetylase n=1 Tax=Aurantimonas sp. HBX-1 TaxID=2906072 RepID=UPI001F25F542|nr:PIG-L family deacetylase [Aurantimonas sp. HBX-1]UIJ73287.1 PIG-L family deacetylase [Aurantimonas sp. HBX-1]
MMATDACAAFGPDATTRLLPHFAAGPDGIRTLGGRAIAVDPAAARLAADLAAETPLARLPLDDAPAAAAFDRLHRASLIAVLPGDWAPDGPVETVILSPHVDDAALSVGAWLASRLGSGGRALVCNIFSDQSYQTGLRVPVPALGEIARAEDRLAGRILGYESRDLGLSGAQDRHRLSLSRTLGWDVHTARTLPGFARELRDLGDRLATILAEPACRNAAVFAPAGIGGHLDHVLTALAARALLDAGVLVSDRVRFYEDLPYAAAEPGKHAENLSRPLATSRKALTLKLAALAVFRTRLRAPQIALCKARAIALGGDGAPAEMTFAAAGAARLAMDRGRAVGSMAP